jgi:hypothetical protein
VMISRVGTELDEEVFGRLNAEISKLPREPRKPICEYCKRDAVHSGLCGIHYSKLRRHGDPLYTRPDIPKICQSPGCDQPSDGIGLCGRHQTRFRRGLAPELQGIVERYRVRKFAVRTK